VNLALGKLLDRWVGIPLAAVAGGAVRLKELVAPAPEVREVRRILCVKLWGIGNVVLLLPILRALRAHYPAARITFLTLEGNREILADEPSLDEVRTLSLRSLPRFAASFLRASARARREPADLFLDFEQFTRVSGLFGLLSGARQRVGLDTPLQRRGGLYTVRVPYDPTRHMSRVFSDVARAGGVPQFAYEPVPFAVGPAERERAASLVAGARAEGRPVVALHPGSGDNFIGRRWPAENFAALADRLAAETGAAIFLTGSGDEAPLAAEVARRMRAGATDLSGRLTLRELGAFLEACDLFVGNDTGPVHVASAFGTPVAALYGPNTPALYGPAGRKKAVFYHHLPCSPCLTNLNAKTSDCRLPVCIRSIEVEEVRSEAIRLLRLSLAARRAGAEPAVEGRDG
jgi:ADP-heptose:LPS heptosyltransferase